MTEAKKCTDLVERVIRTATGLITINFAELWRYRELLVSSPGGYLFATSKPIWALPGWSCSRC